MKYVVVTGASTGIGYTTSKELIQHGYHVFASVRRSADVDRLHHELGERCTPLIFDVTEQAGIDAAAAEVKAMIGNAGLAGLVNNAGIAVAGPVLHVEIEEFRKQFEVNFFGLLAVTKTFLPLLGARRNAPHPPGRIVNISSVSGRWAPPFFAPYAASKHAVEALTDSLRRELMIYGIDVISVQPGSTRTPIWDKAEEEGVEGLAGSDYYEAAKRLLKTAIIQGRRGIPPERIATTVRYALEASAPRPHLTIPDSWLLWWAVQWMPARWLDRILASQLGLQKIGLQKRA